YTVSVSVFLSSLLSPSTTLFRSHQVPVARDDVGPVVDDRVTRPVERGGQPAFRHRHPDGIAEPLAERPRGHLDPAAAPSLRMPRDRKSTRLDSSHLVISYAVFCL